MVIEGAHGMRLMTCPGEVVGRSGPGGILLKWCGTRVRRPSGKVGTVAVATGVAERLTDGRAIRVERTADTLVR